MRPWTATRAEPSRSAISFAVTAEGGFLNYSSSKRALSRWVRRESVSEAWAGAGIPLNAVAPGTVTTPMTAGLLASPEGLAQVDAAVPMPLNYHQPASSIAELLVWLTSPANTHMGRPDHLLRRRRRRGAAR